MDKIRVMARCVWCPAGCTVDKDGAIVGEITSSRHRGYWLNALYSPWLTFTEIACKFIETRHDPAKLMNFVNSWLAEEWVEETGSVEVSVAKTDDAQKFPMYIVPEDTVVVTAGADVHLNRIDYTIRAWLVDDEQSVLIEEGSVNAEAQRQSDLDRLYELIFKSSWSWPGHGQAEVRALAIDSRYRPDEVYAFARRLPERIYPIRGANRPQSAPFRVEQIDNNPSQKRRRRYRSKHHGMMVWTLDTNYYKTMIARLCREKKWHLPEGIPQEYIRQFTAQHKIIIRDTLGRPKEEWVLKPGRRADHKFDCEVYGTAMADILGYWRDLRTIQKPTQSQWEALAKGKSY
jgi:phage terminase large subunit GpA-like protein